MEYNAELHRTGISSTDIAAICGVSPWKRPIDVYAEKLGLMPAQPDNIHMRLGRKLEPVIAELYTEETGKALWEPGLLRHAEQPWIIGTPDRLLVDEPIGLEIKFTNDRQWRNWTDGTNPAVLPQVHWLLNLTDYEAWDIAALVGSDPRFYRVERDRDFENQLVEIGGRFWKDHVEKQIPPPIDASDSYQQFLARQFPQRTAIRLDATPETTELAQKLKKFELEQKILEDRIGLVKNQFRAEIGESAGIRGPDWRIDHIQYKPMTKINYEAIVAVMKPPAELIEKHTKTVLGNRVLRSYWNLKMKGEKNE